MRRRLAIGSTVDPSRDVYSPREIARAAGVDEARVVTALGGPDVYVGPDVFVGYDDAIHLGRKLARDTEDELFMSFSAHEPAHHSGRGVPLAISSSLHAAAIVAALFVTALGVAPAATTTVTQAAEARLVFLATPGPGGGGGGGGRRQLLPAPKAERAGRRPVSSPVAVRELPPPTPPPTPLPRPEPVLSAEALPAVVAPVVSLPSDSRDRAGELDAARSGADSHGPGTGGGAGTGAGSGVGAGQGPGIGAGSGGGTGGGPYRPGSGIQAPRLLHEVKADYTEDARRRGIEGDVVLEIVVRLDGTVGDVRVTEALEPGLDERAVNAVRQWRFAPATRLGSPVDVLVEVAVAFNLR